jgi:hypothetical protein
MPVDSLSQVLGLDGSEQTEHVERVFLLKAFTFSSVGIVEPFLDLDRFRESVAPLAQRPSGRPAVRRWVPTR